MWGVGRRGGGSLLSVQEITLPMISVFIVLGWENPTQQNRPHGKQNTQIEINLGAGPLQWKERLSQNKTIISVHLKRCICIIGRTFFREWYSQDSTGISLIKSMSTAIFQKWQAQAEIFVQIVVRTLIPGSSTPHRIRNMQTSISRTWKKQAKDFSLEEKLFS